MSWSTTLKNRQRIRAALEQGDEIAIMFSDIRGFTSYTAREGDRAAFQLSQLHRRLMEDPIERGGGVLVKTLGDGIMAAFPEPGDGLAAAAATQRDISEHNRQGGDAPFDVGIGLASGSPVMTEGDLIGHSVNLSQRISALAKGGQILVPAELHDNASLPKDTHYLPVGERTLKGLGTIDIYELVWMPERARLTDGDDLITLILTDRDTLVLELSKDLQTTGSSADASTGAFSRRLSRWIRRGTQALIQGSLAAFGVSREHPAEDVSLSLHGRELVVDVAGQSLRLRDVDSEQARRFIEAMERSQASSP
jgi:class 3 adenylate cyclase